MVQPHVMDKITFETDQGIFNATPNPESHVNEWRIGKIKHDGSTWKDDPSQTKIYIARVKYDQWGKAGQEFKFLDENDKEHSLGCLLNIIDGAGLWKIRISRMHEEIWALKRQIECLDEGFEKTAKELSLEQLALDADFDDFDGAGLQYSREGTRITNQQTAIILKKHKEERPQRIKNLRIKSISYLNQKS